jgi:hypothetical protein
LPINEKKRGDEVMELELSHRFGIGAGTLLGSFIILTMREFGYPFNNIIISAAKILVIISIAYIVYLMLSLPTPHRYNGRD